MRIKNKLNEKLSFYIRLSALMMVFLFLIIDLVTAIYFPSAPYDNPLITYGERVAAYYAYFTTESNYLVAIYFSLYLYIVYFKGRLPSFPIQLAVTVYITVTMLVFWFGIFTAYQDPKQYTLYTWFNTIILHLIIPLVMIASFIFSSSGHEKINIKTWHKNYLWVLAIYPAFYSIVIEVRGYLRNLDNRPPDTWFPYPFLNVFVHNGWLFATLAFFMVFGLVFGLQYFFIWINNWQYRRYQSDEERLEEFYLRTLEKAGKRTRKRKGL